MRDFLYDRDQRTRDFKKDRNYVGGTEFYYSFEKSCLSHKLFVTLSSVTKSRQMGRSGVNKYFMWLIWTLGKSRRANDTASIVL